MPASGARRRGRNASGAGRGQRSAAGGRAARGPAARRRISSPSRISSTRSGWRGARASGFRCLRTGRHDLLEQPRLAVDRHLVGAQVAGLDAVLQEAAAVRAITSASPS